MSFTSVFTSADNYTRFNMADMAQQLRLRSIYLPARVPICPVHLNEFWMYLARRWDFVIVEYFRTLITRLSNAKLQEALDTPRCCTFDRIRASALYCFSHHFLVAETVVVAHQGDAATSRWVLKIMYQWKLRDTSGLYLFYLTLNNIQYFYNILYLFNIFLKHFFIFLIINCLNSDFKVYFFM